MFVDDFTSFNCKVGFFMPNGTCYQLERYGYQQYGEYDMNLSFVNCLQRFILRSYGFSADCMVLLSVKSSGRLVGQDQSQSCLDPTSWRRVIWYTHSQCLDCETRFCLATKQSKPMVQRCSQWRHRCFLGRQLLEHTNGTMKPFRRYIRAGLLLKVFRSCLHLPGPPNQSLSPSIWNQCIQKARTSTDH